MNNDKIINNLAKIAGVSRKQVIDTLKRMSAMPEVQNQLKKTNYGRQYKNS